MKNDLSEVVVLAESVHRQFLEAIQLELDNLTIRDINNVRALMLLNIGAAKMSAGELLSRRCYLGSNVSYNLKKLTEAGYVLQERSAHDKRVIMVSNSPKGAELCAVLQEMNARHIQALAKDNFKMEDLITCGQVLRTLQRFWSRAHAVGPTGAATHLARGSATAASLNSRNEGVPAAVAR
jgi:DNA-binding MarR family transcriptional regulator